MPKSKERHAINRLIEVRIIYRRGKPSGIRNANGKRFHSGLVGRRRRIRYRQSSGCGPGNGYRTCIVSGNGSSEGIINDVPSAFVRRKGYGHRSRIGNIDVIRLGVTQSHEIIHPIRVRFDGRSSVRRYDDVERFDVRRAARVRRGVGDREGSGSGRVSGNLTGSGIERESGRQSGHGIGNDVSKVRIVSARERKRGDRDTLVVRLVAYRRRNYRCGIREGDGIGTGRRGRSVAQDVIDGNGTGRSRFRSDGNRTRASSAGGNYDVRVFDDRLVGRSRGNAHRSRTGFRIVDG